VVVVVVVIVSTQMTAATGTVTGATYDLSLAATVPEIPSTRRIESI
jgi:hypothetical protein